MIALVAALVLAQAPDAPVVEQPGHRVVLTAGAAAPFPGVLTATEDYLEEGKTMRRERVTLEEAHKSVLVPIPVAVAVIAGLVATTVAVTIGVMKASEKPHQP